MWRVFEFNYLQEIANKIICSFGIRTGHFVQGTFLPSSEYGVRFTNEIIMSVKQKTVIKLLKTQLENVYAEKYLVRISKKSVGATVCG